jgi:hypothetical protein
MFLLHMLFEKFHHHLEDSLNQVRQFYLFLN